MSGIVGYCGKKKALPILIDCLMRLDYRGYDSAGVAVTAGERIEVRKCKGRIQDLESLLLHEPIREGTLGIGHTRWATHGTPTDESSHPLSDDEERFFVVHNGIIENDTFLRKQLQQKGHRFTTQTDTEVIAHLLAEHDKGDLEETVRSIFPMLEGSFALAIMSKEEPEKIVAISQEIPLVIGFGRHETFLASDIPALLPYTQEIHPILDGEMAVMTSRNVAIKHLDGTAVDASRITVPLNPEEVMLQGYDHYMLKEIFEQPKAVSRTLEGRLENERVHLPELSALAESDVLRQVQKIHIIGSGTSYHSGMIGKKILEKMVDIPVEVSISSEFSYEHGSLGKHTLVIVVSQSGETGDTLSALREAEKHGCTVVAITNRVNGSVARKADYTLYTKAGPELAVAATKAYTSQITALILFSAWLTQHLPHSSWDGLEKLLHSLKRLPQDIDSTLVMVEEAMDQFAQVTDDQDHLFLVGRGMDFVLAQEGALKLQEVAYLHADAYPAGEMKHGTMALITPGVPVIALATQNHLFSKMMSNMKEIKARDAFIVVITTVGNDELGDVADEVMHIPETDPLLMPVLTAIPLQLLAYYSGVVRDIDVDRPRNLAKSLTVE